MTERPTSSRELRAAARARITIDQRRGRRTPEWLKVLARGHVASADDTTTRADDLVRRRNTTYTVTVTYTGRPEPEDDTLADAISDYHATISEHPRGHTEVIATLDEPTIEQAVSRILSVLHSTGLHDPIALEARRTSTTRE